MNDCFKLSTHGGGHFYDSYETGVIHVYEPQDSNVIVSIENTKATGDWTEAHDNEYRVVLWNHKKEGDEIINPHKVTFTISAGTLHKLANELAIRCFEEPLECNEDAYEAHG